MMKVWLCEEPCTKHLPFCQYVRQERGSMLWWEMLEVTKVSSMTSFALAKPASTSPYVHSSVALPSGSCPSLALAKSAALHLSVCNGTEGTGEGGGKTIPTLPSERALGPPGNRLCSGSTVKGNGSRSTLIFSMASCAVVSSAAATATMGWPT